MLYFIRHGESESNLKGLFAGQRENSRLTDKGKRQAKVAALVAIREDIVFDHIFSSPLSRAKETANIIANAIDFPLDKIIIDERITEYDMGSLTGTPIKEISSEKLVAADGAENTKKFQKRVLEFLGEASKLAGGSLIVSHAGVGRIIRASKKKMDANKFYDLTPPPNAQIIRLSL